MPRLIHPQYREDNGESKYPFSDTTSLAAGDGVVLDRGLIIDAVLHLPGATTPTSLVSVRTSATELTFTVRAGLVTASATVTLPDPDPYITLTTPAGQPAGLLLADADLLATLQGWSSGLHEFSAEFALSTCVLGAELGVTGLKAPSGSPLTNDVWLVGEDGVILSAEDGKIRVDVVGEPLVRRRLCDTATTLQSVRYLRTINGEAADTYQNMSLIIGRADTLTPALRVAYENGEIVLSIAGR